MTENRNEEIVKLFEKASSWEEKYKILIQEGKKLPALKEEWRVDDNLVRGCQSRVWIHAEKKPDGKIYFYADSDALITKGLVALLVQLYSGLKPDEILKIDPIFIQKLDIQKNLTPSRANGFYNMVKKIKYYALAFQAQESLTQ
ncbi:MAG: SufE family protein [Bdellovibrio sp.]|nr:MAG: SufE family protein [Bdellovibrio sp.]